MRILGISFISIALTTIVIANAYYQKKQFYPSVVYITKSNPSMAVSNCNIICKKKKLTLKKNRILGNILSSFHMCFSNWKANEKDILW